MRYLGIDIGTTSICGVCLDEDGRQLFSMSLENRYLDEPTEYWEAIQDPDEIVRKVQKIRTMISEKYSDIGKIGISNQMHGILYVDEKGNACSNLYTWQNQLGNRRINEKETYSQKLSALTGYKMATGYGLTTCYYHSLNDQIPREAVKLCTIGDYVVMKLSNMTTPIMHPSNAAGLGCFCMEKNVFDQKALKKAGIPLELLPTVLELCSVGDSPCGADILNAVGDNQASVYGALGADSYMHITAGTSAQLSLVTDKDLKRKSDFEERPYFGKKKMLVAPVLCGGYAYNILKNFLENIFVETKTPVPELYTWMNAAAEKAWSIRKKNPKGQYLQIDTCFMGTRKDPSCSGKISDITPENFNFGELCLGILEGISKELYDFYTEVKDQLPSCEKIYCSGNALRKNPVLVEVLGEMFEKQIVLTDHMEEAAFGAAKLAKRCPD